MSLVRRIARPLLAATFVSSGIDALLHPMNRAERARPLVEALAPRLHLPDDAELVVRGNGALMAGAGLLLATGRLPRLSALALAASAAPATYVDHPFWVEKDPERKRAERVQFLKNLGLLGGVLLAAVDTQGRPGLAWRGRHAVEHVQTNSRHAAREARRATKLAARDASRATRHATKHATKQAKRTAHLDA